MAVVGEAYVVVKAMTGSVENQIKNAFKDADKIGDDVGKRVSTGFNKSFSSRALTTALSGGDLSRFAKDAEAARTKFNELVQSSNFVGTAISEALSSIGALGAGLVSLGSVGIAAAVGGITSLGGSFIALGLGIGTAMLALSGVGNAVQKLIQQQQGLGGVQAGISAQRAVDDAKRASLRLDTDLNRQAVDAVKAKEQVDRDAANAQYNLNTALREGANQLQAIKFAAEDAALGEQKASINLQKARLELIKTQDLPPNNLARKESQLAYAQAELDYRKAQDANKTAAAERTRVVKTGTDADLQNLDSVRSAQLAKDSADRAVTEQAVQRNRQVEDSALRVADAERAITRAIEDQARTAAANNPFINLTDAQKQFAEFIAGLKPVYDSLKQIAAANFFPALEQSINTIINTTLPNLKTGIAEISTALGGAVLNFSSAFKDPATQKSISSIFSTSADVITKFGVASKPIFEAVLKIIEAAGPAIRTFADSVVKSSEVFKKFIDTKYASGELTKFFNTAQDVASQVIHVIGNAFKGLFGIIKANTGPGTGGQILLDYFKKITESFAAFTNSAGGQNTLKKYFSDAATNVVAMLDTFGKFTKLFLQLGADPSVGQFWTRIGDSVPYFKQLFDNFNQAGPALADLFVNFSRFLALVTQGGAVTQFFDVLSKSLGFINDLLANPVINNLLSMLAVVHGFFLGVGLVMKGLDFYFLSFYGHIKFVLGRLGALGTAILRIPVIGPALETGVLKLMYAFDGAKAKLVSLAETMALKAMYALDALKKGMIQLAEKGIAMVVSGFNALKVVMMENPLILVGVIIAALVVAFIELYKHNERFREIVQTVWAEIQKIIDFAWNNVIKPIFAAIKSIGEGLWDGIKIGMQLVWDAIKLIWDALVLYIKTYIAVIKFAISVIWDGLKTGLDAVWTAIKFIWNLIVDGVKAYISTVTTVLSTVWNWLKDGLSAAWNGAKAVWDTIVTFISGLGAKIAKAGAGMWDGLKSGLATVINWIIGALNAAIGGINLLLKGVKFATFGKIDYTISPIPPVALAQGGIVPASTGGTLAVIGEAGRSERVEPLDPDGLSKRDKALVEALAGKNGASGNGMVFNIYPSPGMNERDLAAMVSRQISFLLNKGAMA